MADYDSPSDERGGRASGQHRLRTVVGVVVVLAVLAGAGLLIFTKAVGGRGQQTPTASSPQAPYLRPDDAPMPAISVAGSQILRNGQTWWFLGYNSFTWSDNCNGPDENMSAADVDSWFGSMRHDGHGAVRLFFFPGWDLGRLDQAIASAKRNNIYVTLTLDNGIEGCGAEEKTPAWFADPNKRAVYAEHMTSLLRRYQGESAIAWFEYFNEPSYTDGALAQFYDEMGALAKTIDPNRLFSAGTIAPYALDGDDNFRTVNESPGVDIASMHEYDADQVESQYGQEVLENSAGKPVIVGEFGIYASRTGQGDPGDGQACQGDLTQRASQMQKKADSYINTSVGYAGALAWAWQPGSTLDQCVTGNLQDDQQVQDILRNTGNGS